MEEIDEIWKKAPKFPDVSSGDARIDVDSFVQIYRDVDDLFEVDDDDEEEAESAKSPEEATSASASNDSKAGDEKEDPEEETVEAELEQVFNTICKDGLITKPQLKNWGEIRRLIEEDLLGEDEFDDLWQKTKKSPGSSDQLDVDGFLSFNVALDSLFDFDDDDDEDNSMDSSADSLESSKSEKPVRQMIQGDDLSPEAIFAAIADEGNTVGMEELKLWGDLQDMLDEGDLLLSELQDIFAKVDGKGSGRLDQGSFVKMYEEIDSLFEDDDDDDDEEEEQKEVSGSKQSAVSAKSSGTVTREPPAPRNVKEDLLGFLNVIIEEDDLPCGIECDEEDQEQVLNIVAALEAQPSNVLGVRGTDIPMEELAGTWELLYTSSQSFQFNKGISGFGRTFPNGRFAGLKQKLQASKFRSDLEYIERIEVNPSFASFDVQVTGNWYLVSGLSIFSQKPSLVLNAVPEFVKYGPANEKADYWKTLNPMNMLDLTYLDEDLRVMRGASSPETIFILQRTS